MRKTHMYMCGLATSYNTRCHDCRRPFNAPSVAALQGSRLEIAVQAVTASPSQTGGVLRDGGELSVPELPSRARPV